MHSPLGVHVVKASGCLPEMRGAGLLGLFLLASLPPRSTGSICLPAARSVAPGVTQPPDPVEASCCGLGWLWRDTLRGEDKLASSADKGSITTAIVAAMLVASVTRAKWVDAGRSAPFQDGMRAWCMSKGRTDSVLHVEEKKSFLENSLRARQLMLQGVADGQLPLTPRFYVTFGVLSGCVWGAVVAEFFGIFFQAILPVDRSRRKTFIEGLRERGLIEPDSSAR